VGDHPGRARPDRDLELAGIYDVKSGADGISLDGTRYSDWH
jgi:hypothetical protein